jgi:hypothetical protein
MSSEATSPIPDNLRELYAEAMAGAKALMRMDEDGRWLYPAQNQGDTLVDLIERIASLEAQLEAFKWKPITPDSLPKVGDEVRDQVGTIRDAAIWFHTLAEDWLANLWIEFRAIEVPHNFVSPDSGNIARSE